MCPRLNPVFQRQRGFSAVECLLVLVMISVVAGFAVTSIVRRNRAAYRTSTALELAGYLQKARADSIRRAVTDIKQMAQVKIFNRRFYSVAIDGDADGNLDVPLVKSLPEQAELQISGPFPKTYIFNWEGQTVDLQSHRVAPPLIVVGNGSGTSTIKFSEDGKVIVVSGATIAGR